MNVLLIISYKKRKTSIRCHIIVELIETEVKWNMKAKSIESIFPKMIFFNSVNKWIGNLLKIS